MQSGLVYNVSQEGAASIFTAIPPVLRLLRKWRQQDPSKSWSYKPIYKVHVPEHWSFQKLERENLKPRKEFADFFRSLRLIVQPCDEDDFFFIFPSNEAPVEWNWQGKTEVLGEKPVPVPSCPPQITHGLSRDFFSCPVISLWSILYF